MRFFLCLFAASLISIQSWADFDTAAKAYRLRNYTSAFQQFLPLAEQGDPRAQTVIAMMYKYGEAVEQDQEESFRWYGKAADQGYVPAQYVIGEMVAAGVGVEADKEKAIVWLSLAADAGFTKAIEKLADLKAGVESIKLSREEPIAWSQAWNLRLPDHVRYGMPESSPNETDREIYRVQLGAMKSLASAHRLWSIVRDPNKDLFEGLKPIYKSNPPGNQVIHRLQTGPFESLKTAKRFCEQLVDRGVTSGCLPVRSKNDSNS